MSYTTFSNLLQDTQNSKTEIFLKATGESMGTFYITSASALNAINETIYEIRELAGDALVDTGVFVDPLISLSNNDMCINIISDNTNRIANYRITGSGVTQYAKRIDIREGESTMFVASISEIDGKLFEFYTKDYDIFFTTFKEFIS